ncbi:MAG TPA: DNA polymerase I [Nitrospirota bacterium]|nr:DNA polymerase I [Nitrospirota bacterium]
MKNPNAKTAEGTLYIIDGNSYIYRAFYAVKGLSTSAGLPTNAVFGFTNMLLKVIREKNPSHIAIAFDPKGPTRRHREYKEYKAHRPPMPKDLVPQIPYIHRLVETFRIPVLIQEGQEADDVIATLAVRARNDGMQVVIVTGDKDILQLVGPGITVYDTLKEKVYGPQDVEERYGVPPERMVEIMGLMGDASDNIPGVPGIGEKTAQALIKQYGTIEGLLIHVPEITRPKLRQSLQEHAHLARLSRELARLHTDVPVVVDYPDLILKEPDSSALQSLLRELEFTSLLRHVSHEPEQAVSYETVLTDEDLGKLVSALASAPEFSFDTETTSLDPLRADLVGISFSREPGTAWYLPLGHRYGGAPKQPGREHALALLKPVLEDPAIRKVGQNMKYDILVLGRHGISVKGAAFDTMIASYLLNPSKQSHGLDAIALEYLNYKTITYAEVTGSGKKQIGFDEVDISVATRYSGEDADIALRLKQLLEPKLRELGMEKLFREIEMPLMLVLADMECAGVKVDAALLGSMSQRLEQDLLRLTERIYELAGTRFNINSPKQIGEVLFDKLGLKPLKRTKTGYSTDVDVLQELARSHPLPAEVLAYRGLAKLKSTYVDALPALINPRTGRLHTSFNQTVTATGRLSSSEPNLQNIPIRTEVGREIRKAFIADPGSLLLSADYSQIELRVLAHMSNDPALIGTFMEDQNIHTRTASEIFGLPAEEITSEMRRKAKAVNFGIIYGISAFGLAQDIGVANAEAKRYIDSYFLRYPLVRDFIDRTIQAAHENGFVTTLLGRRRYIPELASSAPAVRNFGERMAVNTPIQGTAADLIKLAMIHIHSEIQREGLRSMMILQVHDELVFEVPENEVARMRQIVKEGMEGVLTLAVPVKVDMETGRNWDEAH